MYVQQDPPQNFGEFGEFGFIPWQAVVGLIQAGIYGGAAATKYSATKKYLKKQEHTQQLTQAEGLKLKQQELANKEHLLDIKGQTEIYEDTRIKKLVIITFVTIISVTIVGLGVYAFSIGGN